MTEILAQLVHEKEVLRNRVNMVEKDLTKARITIDEQQLTIELLRIRIEKLERSLNAYTSI